MLKLVLFKRFRRRIGKCNPGPFLLCVWQVDDDMNKNFWTTSE